MARSSYYDVLNGRIQNFRPGSTLFQVYCGFKDKPDTDFSMGEIKEIHQAADQVIEKLEGRLIKDSRAKRFHFLYS